MTPPAPSSPPAPRCARAATRSRTATTPWRSCARRPAQGAHYVQTPEMTSLVERSREALFEKIGPAGARSDARRPARGRAGEGRLRPYRLARGACGRQGRQPRLPHRSAGRDRRLLRQDPPLRRRSAERRELARIAHLHRRRPGRAGRDALGLSRRDHLLRRALPGALSGARRGRRLLPLGAGLLHPPDRRGPLARAAARPRHRDRLLHDLGGARRASTRTGARPTAIR